MPDPTGTHWRKSSHSGGNGGNCVELAELGDTIAVRDSEHPRRVFSRLVDDIKRHR